MIRKISFLLLMMSVAFIFANDFVIGAYGVDSIEFLSNAHDSLGLNTILTGAKNVNYALGILAKADTETLKVILGQVPAGSWPTRRLSWYCDLWSQIREAEENQIYFAHPVGKAIYDGSASNDSAWVCSLNVHQPGIMQTGRWNWYLKIPTNGDYPADSVRHTARFWLKTDTFDVSSNTVVCSLAICGPEYNPDSIFNDTVLRIKDFPSANQYYPFDLQFRKKPGSNDLIWYVIYWYDNTNLWADYVEVKDCYVDSLTQFPFYYKNKLDTIAQLYSPYYCQYKSLFRFYLRDEPLYGHFPANAYIMDFLKYGPNYQKGVQALGAGGREFFQSYTDSVKPNELMFDYYPFRGAQYSGGRTPEDSGTIFQARLDTLCSQLGDMRIVALQKGLDFWTIPQAFGKYDSATAITSDSGGNEGDWRLPTPRELRCGVWLGLTYGAKGIMYFRYKTRKTNESGFTEWMRGLWRYDNNPREPLYSEARNINAVLKEIGPRLLSLTSDTVFKASDGFPQGCFIKNVIIWNMQDTLIQIGTFHKTNNPDDKYFIIVNRHCLPSEFLEVSVGINSPYALLLYDCFSKDIITSVGGSKSQFYSFRIKLNPGEGKLFRLLTQR